MTCLAIKPSEAVSRAHAALRGTGLFLWPDFDKRITRCIPKSCFPSDCAGKCVRLQIEVCSEVLCCCPVSQSDCHTEQTILMLRVAWHHSLALLFLLESIRWCTVSLWCAPQQQLKKIYHPLSLAGCVYCCIIKYMIIPVMMMQWRLKVPILNTLMRAKLSLQ